MSGPTLRRAGLACGLLAAAALLLAVPLAWWDHQGRWHTPGGDARDLLKLWLWWAGYALPPLLGWALLRAWAVRRPLGRAAWLLMALLLAVGAWARLVEPNLLRVRHTTLQGLPDGAGPLRIALVADVHWGLFTRDGRMQRLLQRLATLPVDAVFVAGDWIYEPPRDLAAGLAGWGGLPMPVFAVLGNHDTQRPGPPLSAALRAALQAQGVVLLEGQRVRWRGWELAGLDDLWGGDPRVQIAQLPAETAARRIVLTHQPDTAALLPPGSARLILAGHTHGGQVRLPWITRRLLRHGTRNPWWDGLYATPAGALLVTPGIGTIGLPLRLGVPPTIDVIAFRP